MARTAAIILILSMCMPEVLPAEMVLEAGEIDSWPVLVISPLVGAAVMSEVFRKPPENRRVSIGLLPGPKGRVFAVVTLRY